jgi:hypothetical protein
MPSLDYRYLNISKKKNYSNTLLGRTAMKGFLYAFTGPLSSVSKIPTYRFGTHRPPGLRLAGAAGVITPYLE